MLNIELAKELVERLNKLIEDEGVRVLLERIIECRFEASPSVAAHPTIRANEEGMVGLLGILNGVVSAEDGYGFIMAIYESEEDPEDPHLVKFAVKE
jgi:hypothetical protein